jgi:hypothetical protein
MANWYNIIIPIAAVVLGFFLGILRQKLFEKKVKLFHKLDNPAVFSVIPPKISFQNLKIANKGKLPAKNLRINLDVDVIKRHDATYKPITEEPYKEETREGVLTLKFDTLLPEEELTVSFKSSEPIPHDFLINIKSDEMLSKKESEQKGKSASEVAQIFIAVIAAGIVTGALFSFVFSTKRTSETYKTLSKPSEQPAISLSLMKDKLIYGKGEKAEVTCKIVNLKKDILRDIRGELEIPGFELNYDQTYMKRKWLESEGQITYRVAFNIPKDVPAGKHKIMLTVRAKSLEKNFTEEAEAFFEVQ